MGRDISMSPRSRARVSSRCHFSSSLSISFFSFCGAQPLWLDTVNELTLTASISHPLISPLLSVFFTTPYGMRRLRNPALSGVPITPSSTGFSPKAGSVQYPTYTTASRLQFSMPLPYYHPASQAAQSLYFLKFIDEEPVATPPCQI